MGSKARAAHPCPNQIWVPPRCQLKSIWYNTAIYCLCENQRSVNVYIWQLCIFAFQQSIQKFYTSRLWLASDWTSQKTSKACKQFILWDWKKMSASYILRQTCGRRKHWICYKNWKHMLQSTHHIYFNSVGVRFNLQIWICGCDIDSTHSG